MNIILETNNLKKKYDNYNVLNQLNIHIEKGTIYGLIGKNGAGKTTFIRIICGLQEQTDGNYILFGINSNDSKITDVRKRIGAIIETPSIYGEMNATENLIEQGKIVGVSNFSNIDNLLKIVGLENEGKKKVKFFSLGMKQRLGIAIALINNPELLILDEPINGLDPQGIIEMRELILKLNKENGITILISSHYLDELSKVATHYGFLDNGSIIEEISSKKLMEKLEYKIEIKVSNQNDFVTFFKESNILYEIIDDKTIRVYGEHNLSSFITKLSKNNLVIDEIYECKETLEDYYMKLIGGAKND